MKRLAALCALMLAGCATTAQLAGRAPDRTYHSAKARDALAECLLNRGAGGDFRVHREEVGGETLVRVTGIAGTYFLFTLRDSVAGGTDVELRRLNSVAPGLHNAETCLT